MNAHGRVITGSWRERTAETGPAGLCDPESDVLRPPILVLARAPPSVFAAADAAVCIRSGRVRDDSVARRWLFIETPSAEVRPGSLLVVLPLAGPVRGPDFVDAKFPGETLVLPPWFSNASPARPPTVQPHVIEHRISLFSSHAVAKCAPPRQWTTSAFPKTW
jgi:hypothetical protein